MHLPYIQVTRETWDYAQQLSGLWSISFGDAFAAVCELWRWGLTLGPDDEPPTGLCPSPRATRLMLAAMRLKGDAEELADILVDLDLVERLPETGLRVKGMDRYHGTWRKNRADTERKPNGDRTGTEREPGGNRSDPTRQIKTQKKNKKEEPPPPPTPSAPILAQALPTDEVGVKREWSRDELATWKGFREWLNGWRVEHGLQPEVDHANGPAWHAKALERCRGDPFLLCDAVLRYHADKTIQAPGHPLAVFMRDSVWPSRIEACA